MDLKTLAATTGAGALLANHSYHDDDDQATDGTESTDDFYDADESNMPIPRSVTPSTANKVPEKNNEEESEFVMIDHPQGKETVFQQQEQPKEPIEKQGEINNEEPAVVAKPEQQQKQPLLTENTKPDVAEERLKSSPFDAVFGVKDNQLHAEEDEPVMISSFTESEVSDPFTASTNSSTHRVAPPPPPPPSHSRQTRSPSINTTSTTIKQQGKKAPAPPPPTQQQPLMSNQDFDAIFGSFGENTAATTANTNNENGFETHFSDPQFTNPQTNTNADSMFAVTPAAVGKAVPSASNSIDQEITKDPVSHLSNDRTNSDEITTAPPTDTNQGEVRDREEVLETKEQDKLKSYKSNENVTETTTKKGELEDKKDKKKKKGLVSWAKNFGGKKKEKEKAKHANSATSSKVNVSESQSHMETMDTAPQQSHSSPVRQQAPTYDIDTIQGSHIAELVGMGFEPAAALEALDRYDQDIEKATNYLLDQSYR